jgi:hypothetical protein
MRLNWIAWAIVVRGGLIAVSSILASIFGAHMIILAIGSTAFTIAAARGALALRERQDRKLLLQAQRQQQLEYAEAQRRQQLKREHEWKRERDKRSLDRECSELVRKAETAVRNIKNYNARIAENFRVPAGEHELSAAVDSILVGAKDITDKRALVNSIIRDSSDPQSLASLNDLMGGFFGGRSNDPRTGIQPGPLTAKAIEPLQKAINIKLKPLKSSVEDLEIISTSANVMYALCRDWTAAQRAERVADQFRDMVASAERDKLVGNELRGLTKTVADAVEAFRQSIEQINRDMETLALPDDEDS